MRQEIRDTKIQASDQGKTHKGKTHQSFLMRENSVHQMYIRIFQTRFQFSDLNITQVKLVKGERNHSRLVQLKFATEGPNFCLR